MSHSFHHWLIATISAILVLLSLASESFAQESVLTLRSQNDRDNCIKAIISKYSDIEDIQGFEGIPVCKFIQASHVDDIRVFLNESLAGNPDFSNLTVRQAESSLGNDYQGKRDAAEKKLNILKEDSAYVSRVLLGKNTESQISAESTKYPEAVLLFEPKISIGSLTSNYGAYGVLPNNLKGSLFNFSPSPTEFPADVDYLYDFPLEGNGDLSDCTSACNLYIENYLLAKIWEELWGLNSQKDVAASRTKIRNALDEYDYFFFEAGDGLYPWELWVNSWGKSDNVFEVPKTKINVLHPSPVVYYNNLGGDIDPSLLIEVLGVTKLNYSKNGSLPIGISAAVDFQNDNIRYGGVAHLPLKGAFKKAGLDSISDFIPTETFSIAVLTDGDDDWSVGLKIDVAGLLYSKDKAKSTYLDFLE